MPQSTDLFGWRCNSCKKVYKVSLKNIQSFAEKKQSGITGSLLKCKECGASLDDGSETIAWKCACGNVMTGNLMHYMNEKEDEIAVVENVSDNINPNLTNCPDCGRQVSKRAEVCPGCGCPLSEMIKSGVVRIKMPNNIVEGWVGLFSSRSATVKDSHGKILWKGQHGENARFTIDEPTRITIYLGGWANEISGTVCPKKKYSLVQDMGLHMFATFRITEVDVIDAD